MKAKQDAAQIEARNAAARAERDARDRRTEQMTGLLISNAKTFTSVEFVMLDLAEKIIAAENELIRRMERAASDLTASAAAMREGRHGLRSCGLLQSGALDIDAAHITLIAQRATLEQLVSARKEKA